MTARPYSRTRAAAGLLFVAGVLGRVGDDLAEGGQAGELAAALRNLDDLLAAHDLDRRAVVRLVVYATDLAEAAVLDEVFATHFPEPRPVRTTVAVTALPAGARVEIEATCELPPA